MNLADYQRALLRMSFSEQDTGELPAFALYRSMIRSRLEGMAQVAYRRSWSVCGHAVMSSSLARFLAGGGSRSPLLRVVIAQFADFAARDLTLSGVALDLLRFEAAKWRTSSAEMPEPSGLREVDFAGVPVLNPTLTLLALCHDATAADAPLAAADPHTLLLYRRRGEDEVRWYRAPDVLGALLTLSGEGERSLGELVQTLFASRAHADAEAETLLAELAAALTVAVERGVLWGVRDPVVVPSPLA